MRAYWTNEYPYFHIIPFHPDTPECPTNPPQRRYSEPLLQPLPFEQPTDHSDTESLSYQSDSQLTSDSRMNPHFPAKFIPCPSCNTLFSSLYELQMHLTYVTSFSTEILILCDYLVIILNPINMESIPCDQRKYTSVRCVNGTFLGRIHLLDTRNGVSVLRRNILRVREMHSYHSSRL